MTVRNRERPWVADVTPLLRRLAGDEKHEASAYDTLDVIQVLYDRILRVDPTRPDAPDRDRFLLSKGHGPHAYYAVLAAHGFFPVEWLDDLAGPDSRLGHHPDRTLVPGVEISSGSLGHGLGLAVGVTLGLRARRLTTPRVYVLLGDGELDEGSNHEAIHYAGAVGLDRLTAVVVAYTHTPRPFDGTGLRSLLGRSVEVVLVEPYLAGTSSRLVADALADVPHRSLALGVGRRDLRRYGSPVDHDRWHGLDPAGLRRSVSAFLDGAGPPAAPPADGAVG